MVGLPSLTLGDVLLWFGAWSLVGFVVMGEDKGLARSQEGAPHPNRISERTLQEVALLGGFVGIILGEKAFRHKTSKPSFWLPVGGAVVLWTAALVLAFQHGLVSF